MGLLEMPEELPLDVAALQPYLDDYILLSKLGQGGMGAAVFLARQLSLDRLVALKMLAWSTELGGDLAERFAREARIMGKVTHPNIVAVHDFIEVERMGCLVLEYVPGETLASRIVEGKHGIAIEEAMEIFEQLCEGLAEAHAHGILHRDLKPSNIFLSEEGEVKLGDFGIAKIIDDHTGRNITKNRTRSGHVLGTPHYMAPEQCEGNSLDERTDIYALGVAAYEMLTGTLPVGRFGRPSEKASRVPRWLDDLVMGMLDESPQKRPASVPDILSVLHRRKKRAGRWVFPERAGWMGRFLKMAAVSATVVAAVLSISWDSWSDRPITNSLGIPMVDVPGESFAVAAWETRVQDFEAFVREVPLAAPGEMRSFTDQARDGSWPLVGHDWREPEFKQSRDHPVVGVSFADGEAFCAWLTERERESGRLDDSREYRLPTVSEWLLATEYLGRFPWGDQWNEIFNEDPVDNFRGQEFTKDPAWRGHSTRLVIGYDDGWLRTSPVNHFPANTLGIFGLAGNVSEWCRADYHNKTDRTAPVLGGSWATAFSYDVDTSLSRSSPVDDRSSCVGFRIVLAPVERSSEVLAMTPSLEKRQDGP